MKNVFTISEHYDFLVKEMDLLAKAMQGDHNPLFEFWNEKRLLFVTRTRDFAIGD